MLVTPNDASCVRFHLYVAWFSVNSFVSLGLTSTQGECSSCVECHARQPREPKEHDSHLSKSKLRTFAPIKALLTAYLVLSPPPRLHETTESVSIFTSLNPPYEDWWSSLNSYVPALVMYLTHGSA